MKICIFHTEFVYAGGAEKLIFQQIDYLQLRGWEVVCFTAFVDRVNCYPDEIKRYEIKQILPEFLNKFIPHDFMIILSTFLFLLTLLRYRDFDLYLGENQVGPWWAAAASFFWRKPYITYQNYPTRITYPRKIDEGARRNMLIIELILVCFKLPLVYLDKLIIRRARVAFGNGSYAIRVLRLAYSREFVNCPAGAKRGKFNRQIFNERLRGYIKVNQEVIKKPYVLITNRHFPAKKLEWGIELLSKLKIKSEKLTVGLVITGAVTGYTEELQSRANIFNVADRVIFTGLVKEQELAVLYRSALIYIYTAPEEDFGLGIIEAMAHGVSVVAWDNAGPAYLVRDGKSGLLARRGKLASFVGHVERLLQDERLNYRIAEQAFAEALLFSWKEHGVRLERQIKQYAKRV